jgi:phytoene/squalene synthetase
MANISTISKTLKPAYPQTDSSLAVSITWKASKQTFYTVRFFVDRELVQDAFRAYAYFRWVDDHLDCDGLEAPERRAFIERQKWLIERCYRGEPPRRLLDEERLLVELIRGKRGESSGLQAYIRNMVAVMAFDAGRRGSLVSQPELERYTHTLAKAVTEALHYFIGNRSKSPHNKARYMAATAAHIAHMLRDTLEDVQAGYYNIPREVIEFYRIDPGDVGCIPYRNWVQSRVQLAQSCFKAGRGYLANVESTRCRIAGYAYIARFESVLQTIIRDGYQLRSEYPECKKASAGARMSWSVLSSALNLRPQPAR